MTPLPSKYIVRDHRLALGIEPIDALRGTRPMVSLRLTADRAPLTAKAPRIERHASGLHALRYQPDLVAGPVAVRIFDSADTVYTPLGDRRRYVPRRLNVPARTSEQADANPAAHRVRRPFLFPGAAYQLAESTTGIRARVLRGTTPLRWTRIEARAAGSVVGRSHGDDRGEFLLAVDPAASGVGDFVDPFVVEVRVFGPAMAPIPPAPETPSLDPLWDLPLETMPAPGTPDDVATGEQLPVGYSLLASRKVELTLGRLRGGVPDFAA